MIWSAERERPAAAISRDREAGFTLIEVMVVVAILALSVVLIVGFKPPWSSGLNVRGAAAQLATALRLARSEAISRDTAVSLAIDAAHRRYRIGQDDEKSLPPGLEVELAAVVSEQHPANAGEIRFNPDGSSTGGLVTLGNASRTVAVGVDRLNGRVSVRDVR